MFDPVITNLYKRAHELRNAQRNYIADGTRSEILGREVHNAAERLDAALQALEDEGYIAVTDLQTPYLRPSAP